MDAVRDGRTDIEPENLDKPASEVFPDKDEDALLDIMLKHVADIEPSPADPASADSADSATGAAA